MKIKAFKKIISKIAVFFAAITIFPLNNALAQEAMITWEAKTYVPPTYIGRPLPNRNSMIEMSISVIDDDRIADISKNEIVWLINGVTVQRGTGLKTITFAANRSESQKVDVTIQKYGKKNISRLAVIPTVFPEIILDTPTLDQTLKQGKLRIGALPYFFNIQSPSQLFLTWETLGATITDTANWVAFVDIDTTNQSRDATLPISVIAENTNSRVETAVRKTTFTIR